MRQRWSAALPVAVLLLGVIESSAQFLGGLANINPQQIASTLSKKSPKDIAADVIGSKHPKKIVEALADTTPAKAAQAMQEDGKKHVQQAAKVINEAKQSVTDAFQGAGLSNITQAVTGSQPAQQGPAAATDPAAPLEPQAASTAQETQPVESSPQKASVVDALQTVSDALEHAGHALNGSRHDGLNGSSPVTVADALKGAVSENLPQSLEQAQKVAKKAIESSPHTEALKKAGQGLADAFHIPKVPEVVKDSHPQAANWLQDALKKVDPSKIDASKIGHTIKHASPKVVDAIKNGKAGEIFKDPATTKRHKVVEPADGGDDEGMGWMPLGIAVCLAIASVAGGYHLFTSFKRRDVRSPTLLTDAEMATWSHSAGQQARSHRADEPLFRQF